MATGLLMVLLLLLSLTQALSALLLSQILETTRALLGAPDPTNGRRRLRLTRLRARGPVPAMVLPDGFTRSGIFTQPESWEVPSEAPDATEATGR